MPNRPPIPAEVEREVLIEAGHRCAVCGADRPLEFAHIVAWSRSKDHSAGNLLCLCASCHGRADTEKWGTKTLRRYKQKPWIRTVRISTGPGGGESEALRPFHQIPPPPADFTGRESELAELRKAVEVEKQGELALAVQSMQVCVEYERELGHPNAETHAAHVQETRARLGGELDPEAQAELWQSWTEGGPQGPIEDEDELP